MKLTRRIIAFAVLATFLFGSIPKPAAAVSTAAEIRIGQDAAKQVEAQNQLVEDPILNNWVSSLGTRLATYRARPDIHYSIKIIDTNDINAFSLPGGFVYFNFGLLNFVNSDDELAGVIGHEFGHVERRHSITLNAKAQALNIIIGILSLASPFVYRFGNLLGNLALFKMSRVDELQADQYGLLLMTRGGYDPNAMVSFMERLGKESGHGSGAIDKYFETHPDPKARIAHLLGYPELSKTNTAQLLAQAIHDEDEGRYAYALNKINDVLKLEPQNQLAMLHKGQIELALGSFEQSHLALAEVAASPKSGAAGVSAAQRVLAMLPRADDPPPSILHPNLDTLRRQVADAHAKAVANQPSIEDRVKLVKTDLHNFGERINALTYEVPNFSNMDIRPGSRLDGVITDIEHMARDLNIIFDKTTYFETSAAGLQKDNISALNELDAPLRARAPSVSAVTTFPYYPQMIAELNTSSQELDTGLTATRGSLALAWQTLQPLDAYFRQLDRTEVNFGGDITQRSADTLKPLAAAAIKALDAAANGAELAQRQYFTAQSRELEVRITMLGVGYPEARYRSLTHAIHYRLGVDAPSYDQAQRLGISPGQIAVAAWLAAEEKVPVSTVINQQRAANQTFIDMGLAKNLSQESQEVVLGLWWEGYAEKPTE